MKFFHTLLFSLFLLSSISMAQSSVKFDIEVEASVNGIITLLQEDVEFYPNLGVGLVESRLMPIASMQLNTLHQKQVEAQIDRAKIFRLRFNGDGINKTWMLFIQPGDVLKAYIGKNHEIEFSGTNAYYQDFLKTYFLENQYQYLPVFGYKPQEINNQMVIVQSDSLTQLRLSALAAFKKSNKPVIAFEEYVLATTMAEPLELYRQIQEKIMRKNRALRLDSLQRHALEDNTLANFKLMNDHALLSHAYRSELRNWISIPSLRKFPLNNDSRYEISPDALKDLYSNSEAKMAGKPNQMEYLLTYWLNYAVNSLPTLEPAKELLAKYQRTFPNSTSKGYLAKQVETKAKMVPGAKLPDIELLKMDGSKVKFSDFKQKPLVLVFAYSIGQHEPDLRKMEEKFNGKVQFAYISVIPGMNLETLNKILKDRPTAIHLLATDKARQFLEENFAIGIRYPFMVVGVDGKIVERWIPQEFPNNNSLQTAILKSLK